MATSLKWEAGSIQTLLSTELNSLANNANSAVGSAYDNSSNLYTHALFEVNATFGTNPTAGSTLDLYLVPAPDGTNYDDGGGSVTPPSTEYLGSAPLRAVTTAQKIAVGAGSMGLLQIPPVPFKLVLRNNASGQTMAASGNTVKMVPYRLQAV